MRNIQRVGGWAALFSAGIAVGNLLVVFGILGAEVAGDPTRIAALVTARPAPLLWLEFFKVLAAGASWVVIWVMWRRLYARAGAILSIATWSGVASVLLLVLAGGLGALAILHAGYGWGIAYWPAGLTVAGMNTWINRLGLAALFANGLWLLGIGWAAGGSRHLSAGLCRLSFALGMISLATFFLPPLVLLVLILGLGWSLWLGRTWLARC